MRICFLVAVLLQSVLSFAQKYNAFDSNGKRHGIWKKYYENTDVPRYEGQFKHGKEIGVFKFYKNHKGKPVLMATRTFSETNDTVMVSFFAENGSLVSTGKMLNKKHVGKWLIYHKNSKQILNEEYYNSGTLEGKRTTFYESGILAKLEHYKAGVLHGISKLYSKTGKVISLYTYNNGELHGPYKSYDVKGNLKIEGEYQNDRRHGMWQFYNEGKLVSSKDFTRRSKNPYKKKKQ